MSPITNGMYVITSAMGGNSFIGRPLAEDRSLLPKRVVTLPTQQGPPRPWVVIQNEGTDTYTLKVADAPTTYIDQVLFGVLLDMPPATAWKLTPVPQHGDEAYIVTTEDQSVGWVVPDEEPYTQIAVRPLIVGPSEPPFYPPNEVFIFKRLEMD